MPHEKWLIDGDIFQRLDTLAFFNLKHTVYQQNRVAMRQLFQNLMNVHHDYFSLTIFRFKRFFKLIFHLF